MTINKAGKIRLILRAKKSVSLNVPVSKSLMIFLVIKYPEITKNRSTPTYPKGSQFSFKWKTMTRRTAMPLSPFMSVLNLGLNSVMAECVFKGLSLLYFRVLLNVFVARGGEIGSRNSVL